MQQVHVADGLISDGHDDGWPREALRLHHRYQREIVEAFTLCPWAKRSRTGEAARERVLLQDDPAGLEPSLAALAELDSDPNTEVAFLIYPRLSLGRRAFEEFAARIRTADADRRELGSAPFVFAAFHPDAEADTRDHERLIPFLRRTPDPTLQLLRSTVLERVRGGAPQGTQFVDPASVFAVAPEPPLVPLREQVARANLATIHRAGVDEVKRCLDDIQRDRDAAYALLART